MRTKCSLPWNSWRKRVWCSDCAIRMQMAVPHGSHFSPSESKWLSQNTLNSCASSFPYCQIDPFEFVADEDLVRDRQPGLPVHLVRTMVSDCSVSPAWHVIFKDTCAVEKVLLCTFLTEWHTKTWIKMLFSACSAVFVEILTGARVPLFR